MQITTKHKIILKYLEALVKKSWFEFENTITTQAGCYFYFKLVLAASGSKLRILT